MNIFISYRRNNGIDVAGRIASYFAQRNFNVFYDVQSMQLGLFPNQIINNIKNCDHFILVLSPNALDRCIDEDDWVRKEIETALKYDKNIIPFVMPEFEFPRDLPKSIETIKNFQSIEYNSVLFDYVLNDLERKLTKSYTLYENIKIEFSVCHCCRAKIDYMMRGEKCPQKYLGKVGYNTFESKNDVPLWYVPAVNLKIYNLRASPILLDDHTPTISGKMILASGVEIQSIMIKTFASPAAHNPVVLQPGECFNGNLQGESGLLAVQAFNNHNGQLNLSINGNAQNIELDELKKESNYCKNIIGEDYETIRKSIKKFFTEAELAKYAEEKTDYAEMDAAYGGQLKEKDGKIAKRNEYDKKVIKARTLAIRGMYDEAKAIYDAMIDEDPTDMNGYMGLIRIESKNYTEYEGEGIGNAIRVAKQIYGGEEIGECDPDYAAYAAHSEKYFADKAEAERKAREEVERKAEEERKAREDAAIPHREGNKIIFGLWPQSGKALYVTVGGSADEDGYYTGSDGALYAKVGDKYFKVEPIEWQILSESGGKAIILSKAILANMAYHGSSNNYANSDVREWLNGEFYNIAFSAKSKNYIETTTVDNSVKSTGYSSNKYACGNTNDKVFLLSYEEAAFHKYGLTGSSRQKKPTEYAKATGADVNSDNGNGWWWLRSPSSDDDVGAREVGSVGDNRWYRIGNSGGGVVPALLIRL